MYISYINASSSKYAFSKDILARWTFPLVPDNNYPGSASTSYEHTRGNKYLSVVTPPQLARTSQIGALTLLGPGTSIASDARIVRSVLGANCVLGMGAVVTDSVLWDGVRVETGAVVEGSVLGNGVTVLKGSRIERGCLVADGVVVGPEARLRRLTRVSGKRKAVEDEESEDSEIEEVEAGRIFPLPMDL